MNKITIALAQFKSEMGKCEENFEKAKNAIEQASRNGSKIIVFPELYYPGYYNDNETFHKLAEFQDGDLFKKLSYVCKKNDIYVVMGYCEKKIEEKNKVFNSLMIVDDNGERIANYTKVFGWDKENEIFTNGKHFEVCQTSFGKVGFLLCYDIDFPETFRILNMKGAELVICCAAWRTCYSHRWNLGLSYGAATNLCFTVGCNTVGNNLAYQQLYGNSQIVNPNGEVIHKADKTEQVLYTTIDMDDVKNCRDEYSIWKDYKYNMINKSFLEEF